MVWAAVLGPCHTPAQAVKSGAKPAALWGILPTKPD